MKLERMKNYWKHIIAVALLALSSLQPSLYAQSDSTTLTGMKAIRDWVEIGDQLYRQGDYAVAIDYYGLALSANYASAELYYNLGNAYYRVDNIGMAILNYERALRLKPSMKDALENLELANARTADRITVLPRLLVVRLVDWLCTAITPSHWRVICLVILALLGMAFVVLRLSPSRNLRKAGLAACFATAFLFIIATLLMIGSSSRFSAHRDAIILDPSIVMKSSPESSSTDKMILHEGTKVHIGDELSGWYKITIADGTTGWCRADEVERI